MPPHNTLEQMLAECDRLGVSTAHGAVVDVLTALADVSFASLPSLDIGTKSDYISDRRMGADPIGGPRGFRVTAKRNSWSRKARRARNVIPTAATEDSSVMIVDLFITQSLQKGRESWVLTGTWRRGRDRELFESFWSHVSRKVYFAVGSCSS